jgi:hypothetical protein
MSEASDNLAANQRQLDMDGCEVGVSRQAVEETLAEYVRMRDALEKIIPLDIHHRTYGDGSESTGCGPIALIAKRALGRHAPAPTAVPTNQHPAKDERC